MIIISTRVSKTSILYVKISIFLLLLVSFQFLQSWHVDLQDYTVADDHPDSVYFRLTRKNSRAKTFPALRASVRLALFFVKKCRSSSWLVPFVRTSSPSSRKFSGRFRACETFAAPFAACCGRYRVLADSPSP